MISLSICMFMGMMSENKLEKKTLNVRLGVLEALRNKSLPYAGSMMSCVEILVSLYEVMKFDVAVPGWDGQDYLVYGKPHAALSWYSVLAGEGFFGKEELLSVGTGMLSEIPNVKIPGVNVAVNDRGEALSVAMGMALAVKKDRQSNKVYCLIGDGELQSGGVWEAAMASANFNLDNLIVVIDNNKMQGSSAVASVMDIGSIQDKFEAFGWSVIQVMDGHDFGQTLNALDRARTSNRKPVCVWCHTVSGKGLEFVEGKESYHSAALSSSELDELIPKFKAKI